jgi:hypothetical protein
MDGIGAMWGLTGTSKLWWRNVGAEFGDGKFRTGPGCGGLSWKPPALSARVCLRTQAGNGSGEYSVSDGQIGVDPMVICPIFKEWEVSIEAQAAPNAVEFD